MKINDKSLSAEEQALASDRYDKMKYNRCGNSGVLLPAISLGLWHNFGAFDDYANCSDILTTAFDTGITHFDLANNYGPPYGSAEETFGKILKDSLSGFRDQLFIATKAGYDMWPGPYGNMGSRKYLISSLDQSLKRMGLEYVDLFYHHRPDLETPLEETMLALADIVRQGKALYVGLSNYDAVRTAEASAILKELKVPFIIHQARYSLFDRSVEKSLLGTLEEENIGCIAFSPLAQGMLTDRYLDGIPEDSRAAKSMTYLQRESVEEKLPKIKALAAIAKNRGQSLSQMAIAWLLTRPAVASVLLGASSAGQLKQNLDFLSKTGFSEDELAEIDRVTL